MSISAKTLIYAYYAAFNAGDFDSMLELMTEDVAHDINQGGREIGRAAFADFMRKMGNNYRETLRDIVVLVDNSGSRAAAEFTVHGASDEGLPAAKGQNYVLPGGAFFQVREGRIARVTNFYNLQDWLAQVR